MGVEGSGSEFTRIWNRSVDEGRVQATTILEDELTIRGLTFPPGTAVRYGLRNEGGRRTMFARAEAGPGAALAEVCPEWESKSLGDFTVVYAGIRAIRPGRGRDLPIGRRPDFVPRDAADCPFDCLGGESPLSILRRDPLMEVQLGHGSYAVLHNALFFDPRGHAMLIPSERGAGRLAYPHRRQCLTRPDLDAMVEFQRENPDLLGFFNATHAGSSVDHIHMQFVHHGEPLAIEAAPTIRVGDLQVLGDAYPARALAFAREEALSTVFRYVDRCQARGIPFNLIVTGEKSFLALRDRDHEVVPEFPHGVLASMDVAGRLIVDSRRVYEEVTLESIVSGLRSTTIQDLRVILG